MEVSFKGINNLYIGKKCYSKVGSYLAHDGQLKQGPKKYTDILIRCNLTDDASGKHLTEFCEALAKCRPEYRKNCINDKNPSQVSILMHHFYAPDGAGVQNSTFKINDYDITLNEREVLPLFTYMAKLTRLLAFAKGPSENQRNTAKFVNAAVYNEAINYIENIMPISKIK